MSDQTKIQTAGPVDPNAPARSKSYAVGGLLLAAIPVLVAFKVLTHEQATSLIETYSAVGGLLGAFGLSFAAFKTRTQVANGTFDPPVEVPVEVPVVVPLSPVEKVTSAVQDARDIVDGVQRAGPAAGHRRRRHRPRLGVTGSAGPAR